jgi:hypothetical protein
MINKSSWQISALLAVGAASLCLNSCVYDPFTYSGPRYPSLVVPPVDQLGTDNARNYNLALAEAIQRADKIVVSEHSDKVDFLNTPAGIYSPPRYVYSQQVLSAGDKMLFLDSVRSLGGAVKSTSTNCLFVAHHTIDFYEQGILKSSMKISFNCSDVAWNGSSLEASGNILDAVTPVISRVGMKVNRNWDGMAKERYEKVNNPRNADAIQAITGPQTAKWAPGQEGKKVINPFTGQLVDVEGIPAGTKVRDPNDKDTSHVFRVPEK